MLKKRNQGLSEEALAVSRNSPSLKPCWEFRKADIVRFVENL